MAGINYAFKEISCKIVYYGPGLCGKTTNLRQIHNTVPQKFRGDLVSLATETDRTLFFDFLPIDLGEVRGFKTKFQLYTVPGQVYYNATRRLVLRGVDGIVFVADSAADRMEENRDSLTNLRENLESYGLNLDAIPWCIQYNKRDLPNAVPREEIDALLNPDHVPSFEATAVKGIGVKETLKGISALVLRHLAEITGSLQDMSALEKRAGGDTQARLRESHASQVIGPGDMGKPPTAQEPVVIPAAIQRPSTATPKPEPSIAAKAAPPSPPAGGSSDTQGLAADAVPQVHVLQKSDLRWRGFVIGNAIVELTPQSERNRQGAYLLTCHSTCLGLFRRTWSCALRLRSEEAKVLDYRTIPFYLFESAAGGSDQAGGDVRVWVENALGKSCFISYSTFGGKVQLTPMGHAWFD